LLVLFLLGSAYAASNQDDFTEFDDADSVVAPPPQVTLDPINGIDFGVNNYGPQVSCPAGASITGFMIKTGPTNSYFTETAGITGIQLRCNSLPQKKLTSLHSVGRWEKKFVICPGDFLLTGINLRITREMGEDTKHGASVTGIRFRCADTLGNFTEFSHTVDVPDTSDSQWALETALCPDLYAVVGFKTILGTVAYGSRLNTVSMLCEKRWDNCRGCDGHGSCVLARNATDHEVQVCKCNPGWHGPFCTWHIAPAVAGLPQVRAADDSPFLLEGQDLTCAYNLTLDGSKEDTSKTLVQWFYGQDFHKVIYSGPVLPGNLAFAGVKISCSVLPCDNFPTSFCAPVPVKTGAPVLISGTYNFSYAPVGWKSFQVADVHILVSNFTIAYEEVKQFCTNIGARRVVLPSHISQTDFGIALKAEGITSVWMYGFKGQAGTCRRFDNIQGEVKCQVTVANTTPIRATCMRFFEDPHLIASYSFRQEKKNWATAQGTCKQQYAGHLTGQWTWSHVKADTETLKLYGSTQAWNGGFFDADAKIWGWTAGGNFTTITPWLDGEPRLNGYDLSRCVAYNTPAVLGSKLWKVNECDTESNPFICEGVLAQIYTTTNKVIITKPDQMYSNVDPLFQVSLYDIDKQLLASGTLGEFTTPNKIDATPGTQYMIQFKATHEDFGVKTVNLPVKTACDCDLNPYRNGGPTNFVATQKEGFIRFTWETNSACANSWTLTRDGAFLLSVNISAFVCGSGPNNVTDPNAFEPVNRLRPGSKPVYCLAMRNNETGYTAPVVCIRPQIEFFSLGHFEFTYSSVAIPADDVRIVWQLFDPWTKTGTYTFPYSPDVRPTQILESGESVSSDSGVIQLQVQSDKFYHNDILARLVVYKSTLKEFDPLKILGAGNYTGVYECTKWDQFTVPRPPLPDSFMFYVPWTCYTNLTHGVTRKYPVSDTYPLIEVRGRILFPLGDPKIKSPRCSVFNATVCYRHDQGRKTYCNQTRTTGGYSLFVPAGGSYRVSAWIDIAGARFMAEPQTCVSGGSIKDTYFCYHPRTQGWLDYDIFYVKEKRQIRLQAYGGSAVCTQPLGGSAQWKLESHPDEECRLEATITATDSDPEDVPLYPMRYTARFIGFTNPPDDVNQRGIMEDASAFFRLTYPDGYFANLRGVGIGAPFPAIFEYHPSIQVDIVRVGDHMDDCNGIPMAPGYPDRIPIRIVVRAWEMFGPFKCPVTGSVLWYDGLIDVDTGNTMNARCNGCYEGCYGDSAGCAIRLGVPEGQMYGEAVIQTIPGRPAANPPWTRSVTVKAFQRGGESTEVTRSIILTGEGTTPVPFADAIPDVLMPSIFLYDPPGGSSYSFLESGTVLTDEYSMTTTGTTGFSLETQFGMGVDLSEGICVGFGVYACIEVREEIKGGISSSIGFEMTYGGGVGYSNSIRLTTEITTAQEPGLVDGLGDVIVLKVVSFQYLPTYYVKATKTANGTCTMSKTRGANKWLPAVDGLAIYNMWDVQNLIPRLQADLENLNTHTPTPSWAQDEIEDWATRKVAIQRGIDTWLGIREYWKQGRQVGPFPDAVKWSAAQNSQMCRGADCGPLSTFEDVISFGAGADIIYTLEVTESLEEKYDSTLGLEIELGLNMKLDFDIFKFNINFEMSLKIKQALTLAGSYKEGEERTTKVGFHLNDEDFGDSFTVEIWYNKRYGTPMFKLLGGSSRCPWEEGTIQRDRITVSIDADAQYNVLPNAIVPYRISVAAIEGESLAGMNYLVFQRQATNQNGAELYWDGLPIDNEFGINLRVSGEYYMDLRRPPDYYNFTGITIDFYDACEAQLDEENALGREPYKETIVVTALFLQPCAQIAWSEDWDRDVKYNFILNAASMAKERIEVSVVNPGFPNVLWRENLHFDKVVVLYRHVEYDDWSVAYLDTKTNLPAYVSETDYGYMKFELDTSEWLIEGEYEIMLKSYCQHDTALPNEFLSQETPARLGLVDRTPPRIFGFPSPANGRYLPGDVVGLTFQEPIDCNRRNYPNGKFNVTISWGSGGRPEIHSAEDNYLFFLCDGNQFTITWGLAMDITPLLEREVTIRVAGIQDVAGNVMTSPVTWTFIPTTFIARSAMLKIDGLELTGVTPAKFIADYYTTHKLVAEDRMVTDNDPFSSFGVAFCAKFDSVVAVERMQGRCELLKYYVDERSNTFVSFAITPGTPSANSIFEQFKNALEKVPKLKTNTTTPKDNSTKTNDDGLPEEEVRRKRVEATPNLMGAVNSNSAKTSWDSTTNGDTIRSTLKQPVYPMRYFEAIALVPAGFFVTMAIGIACGTLFLIIILILNKQREKHWNGKVSEREHALLPHALQKSMETQKGYEMH